MNVAVFCGPSLPAPDRVQAAGLTYLPPAARDDVLRASEAYEAILLIDGVFHHDLAPAPKEIYDVCRRVPFFGASSMGALRAAECVPYGAVALGAVATWYLRETIDGDDEVAVLVDPRTQTALTVPSVNVRYVARLAQRRGILNRGEAETMVRGARDVFYMVRTWDDVMSFVPEERRRAVLAIAEREGDLKRWDAQFALRSVLRRLSRGGERQFP